MHNPAEPRRTAAIVSLPVPGRVAPRGATTGTTRIELDVEQRDAFQVGERVLVHAAGRARGSRVACGVVRERGVVHLPHDFAPEGTRVWLRRPLQRDSTCTPVAGGSEQTSRTERSGASGEVSG